jgi:hypothetical protein
MSINGKNKDEIYHLNDSLVNEFMKFEGDKINMLKEVNEKVDKLLEDQISNFMNFLNKLRLDTDLSLLKDINLTDESYNSLINLRFTQNYNISMEELKYFMLKENIKIQLKDKEVDLEKEITKQEIEKSTQETHKIKYMELQIEFYKLQNKS